MQKPDHCLFPPTLFPQGETVIFQLSADVVCQRDSSSIVLATFSLQLLLDFSVIVRIYCCSSDRHSLVSVLVWPRFCLMPVIFWVKNHFARCCNIVNAICFFKIWPFFIIRVKSVYIPCFVPAVIAILYRIKSLVEA